MLKDILSKLGASTKTTIGVSISPNIGLEMIEIDDATGTISKYTYRKLEYSSSLREIADYSDMKDALEDMYTELDIPFTSNVVVSMPNVHFGTITLPLLLPDEGITNAIISEVEQSYVFKRSEPIVSWSDVSVNNASDSRFIAYSAIQKNTVEKILDVFDSLGAKVIAIENSYNSLFRALSYLKITEAQMQDNTTWNLMVVMQNSYAIISMVGKRPVDYFEEPLALKTFVDEEIYNAIKTSAQMTLMGLPASYLVIVSETDLVSAEILSMKLPFEGTVSFVESNKFSNQEFMPMSLDILKNNALMLTISAIGTGARQFHDYPLKLNFVQRDEESDFVDSVDYPKMILGNSEIEVTPPFVRKAAIILAIFILLPLMVTYGVLDKVIYPKTRNQLQEREDKITEYKNRIQQYIEANNNMAFDIYNVITANLDANKNKLINFRALEYSMPKNLWITYYETDSLGRVAIKGTTGSTQDIYAFYKNLKQLVNNSNIMLKRLELSENALDTMALSYSAGKRYYQFEISNMPRTQSASLADAAKQNTDQEAAKRSLFELGQPWLMTDDADIGAANGGMPSNLKKIENFQ